MRYEVSFGIDVLCATSQFDPLFAGKRVGLITTPTGMDRSFTSTIDLLHSRYRLTALFAPEHGVRGNVDAGCHLDSYLDAATGIPVYSLYRKDSKRLTPDMLREVDVMVYDIQDVGSRYFTFLYTLLYALQDCAAAGIPFVVLDRPDPLGGLVVEGNIIEPEYFSFVGDFPLCNRYGMTCGEFAQMVDSTLHLGAELTVIPCAGWRRGTLFCEMERPWVAPSPALTTFESALLYSGSCLFEGTNLSEGRGTAAPFRWIGAPYIDDPSGLAHTLNAQSHTGILFRPIWFTPLYGKHTGCLCGGVELHLTDATAARPLRASLALLFAVRQRWGEQFEWATPLPPATREHIELLFGSGELTDDRTLDEIQRHYDTDEQRFLAQKQPHHIYE